MKLLVLGLLLEAVGCGIALQIAAFNIQVFGVTKFGKPEVVETLSQIVQRYDIVLIQEIRDASQTVIHSFVDVVNSNRAEGVTYAVEVSERLGRTSSKEQYAFMYRTDLVEILDTFQYNDSVDDIFEREPFSVLVRSKEAGRVLPDFFLVGVHVQPSNAFAEIDALLDVYEETADYFAIEDGIIMGDFNADCSYLSQGNFEMLSIVIDDRFTFLIDETMDTTTAASHCTYDRIVIVGNITQSVVPESAQVFRYDLEYDLTQEAAEDVSDHFPVEVEIEGQLITELHVSTTAVVETDHTISGSTPTVTPSVTPSKRIIPSITPSGTPVSGTSPLIPSGIVSLLAVLACIKLNQLH